MSAELNHGPTTSSRLESGHLVVDEIRPAVSVFAGHPLLLRPMIEAGVCHPQDFPCTPYIDSYCSLPHGPFYR